MASACRAISASSCSATFFCCSCALWQPVQRCANSAAPSGAAAGEGAGAGGVEKISADAASRQALPDAAIVALTALGQRVSTLYANVPQDIEWAWADDTLYLLQARPITSLFPLPDTLPPGEKKKQVGAAVPLGYMGAPADIAGAAVFLASDEASYITAQTLNVDGGNVMS